MSKRFPTRCAWALGYFALIAFGARFGIQPIVVASILLVLGVPPIFFCMKAVRDVTNRTRTAFPEQWTVLNRDWLKLELRLFLFDQRTFGDEMLATWKHELRWWMRAGILALVLFLPTLLLVEILSK